MFTICFNSFIFVLQVAFVLKRSIPLVRGNQMHRVLTDTAKKNDEKLSRTMIRAHKHTHTSGTSQTLSRGALVQNNKMFKNEKSRFQN